MDSEVRPTPAEEGVDAPEAELVTAEPPPKVALLEEPIRIKRASFRVVDPPEVIVSRQHADDETTHVVHYRVIVEEGLEGEATELTRTIDVVLNHSDGWRKAGYAFKQVEDDEDITILLANPKTVDSLCLPMQTGGVLSCAARRRAHLNYRRWTQGAKTWGSEVKGYRSYLINHEVGHLLGMPHMKCPGTGAPAPVMLPQTKYLDGCAPNGLPTTSERGILKRWKSRRADRWKKP
ncbi:MAG: hypothetical protein CMH57_13845 [Myxococcales bacterium]|nr:hypothetical protein [Myxococcales bacterium]